MLLMFLLFLLLLFFNFSLTVLQGQTEACKPVSKIYCTGPVNENIIIITWKQKLYCDITCYKGKAMPVCAMKAYRGVEVWLHLFLTLPIYACEWSGQHSGYYVPRESAPPPFPSENGAGLAPEPVWMFWNRARAGSFTDCTILGPVKYYRTAKKIPFGLCTNFTTTIIKYTTQFLWSVPLNPEPHFPQYIDMTLFMHATIATNLKSSKYAKL